MPSLKLTKTPVETARPEARDYELRDTTLPGFICKASFTHVSPDRPSRFTQGDFGVLYIADRFETALLETMYHHARFMAHTVEAPGWASQFRELVLDLTADLHDLRGGAAAFIRALDPDNYDEGQALVVSLRAGGSDGSTSTAMRAVAKSIASAN